MFNATIVGRLVRDVSKSVYNQKSGAILCRSTMAVEVGYNKETKEKIVNYIDIVGFGNVADTLASYGRKGNGFIMNGNVEVRSYKGKDGTDKVSVQMTVNQCNIFSNLHANELREQQSKVGNTPIQEANQDIQQVIVDDDLPF